MEHYHPRNLQWPPSSFFFLYRPQKQPIPSANTIGLFSVFELYTYIPYMSYSIELILHPHHVCELYLYSCSYAFSLLFSVPFMSTFPRFLLTQFIGLFSVWGYLDSTSLFPTNLQALASAGSYSFYCLRACILKNLRMSCPFCEVIL